MHVTATGIHFTCSLFCIFLLLLLTYIQHNLPPLSHTQCNNNNNKVIITPSINIAVVVGVLFQVYSASARKLQCVFSLQFNQFNLANFIELSRSTDRQLITWPLTRRKYIWTHDGGFVSSNVLFRNYRYSPNHSKSPYIFSFSVESPSNAVGITLTP